MSSPRPLPNVLWIMTDEQRCDSLGCYGSPWAQTPRIDALAASGALFRQAATPSPMCIPARTSFLTGRTPAETGVWQNAENPRRREGIPSLIRDFQREGYECASFGKQHYLLDDPAFEYEEQIVLTDLVDYTHFAEGIDESVAGVIRFRGPTAWILGGAFPGDASETAEAQVLRRTMEWLDRRDTSRPFFLRVSFNGPHTPVVPPRPYDTVIPPENISFATASEPRLSPAPLWLDSLVDGYAGSDRLSREEIREIRRYYYGYAAFLDTITGDLLDRIAERSDDTIVCYTSDHGTLLGDHGLVQKQTFFEPVVNVPCILSWPGHLPRGHVVQGPVEAISLLEWIAGLIGIESTMTANDDGVLQALETSTQPEQRPVTSAFTLNPAVIRTHSRIVMVRMGALKLVVDVDGEPENPWLFDLDSDPSETTNHASDAAYAHDRGELEGHLARVLA